MPNNMVKIKEEIYNQVNHEVDDLGYEELQAEHLREDAEQAERSEMEYLEDNGWEPVDL